MDLSNDLAVLFRRDIERLIQEIEAFPDEKSLWECPAGMSNSAGNLALHLVGNLREFVGRQLGGVPYERQRDLEFSSIGIPAAELVQRIAEVRELIPGVIAAVTPGAMEAGHPDGVSRGMPSTRQFLFHLLGHFSYHLGQIDAMRRILTKGTAITFAGL